MPLHGLAFTPVKCPVPGLLDPLHHRGCYPAKKLFKSFKNLFCQNLSYFVKICLFCQNLFFFVNICLFLSIFVKFWSIFVKLCFYLSICCQNLSLFVFICLMYVFICLYLSVFVFICLYLSLFVFILSKFVNIWLSCLQNLYKSKSPISRSPQPVNDMGIFTESPSQVRMVTAVRGLIVIKLSH